MPDLNLTVILSSVLYTLLGLVLFGLSLWIAARLAPFSLQKEVEEDHNVAVGVIIGAMFIGIAIIISAAID